MRKPTLFHSSKSIFFLLQNPENPKENNVSIKSSIDTQKDFFVNDTKLKSTIPPITTARSLLLYETFIQNIYVILMAAITNIKRTLFKSAKS
jgi:hypothetical protein